MRFKRANKTAVAIRDIYFALMQIDNIVSLFCLNPVEVDGKPNILACK